MPVTVTKKMTLKQLENEKLNEKNLFWISSLRQLIPPVGDEATWKKMSPAACKIYLLIWALDSARWQIPPHQNEPYKGVHLAGTFLYSGLKPITVKKTLNELVKMGLIKKTMVTYPDPSIVGEHPIYNIIYNLPPDVIENGV